jgi:hypothetical protein
MWPERVFYTNSLFILNAFLCSFFFFLNGKVIIIYKMWEIGIRSQIVQEQRNLQKNIDTQKSPGSEHQRYSTNKKAEGTKTTTTPNKHRNQTSKKKNNTTKNPIEATGTPHHPLREPGPTTQTPYRNQHRTGCASHSYKEQRLTELLPRNHFQDESFTLSTKSSTDGLPPAKMMSLREFQIAHTTASQIKIKPRVTLCMVLYFIL